MEAGVHPREFIVMDIEKLKSYRGIISEIEALETELCFLEHSSQMDQTGIKAIKERLTEKYEQMKNTKLEIETWLDNLGDAEIRSIVRWHYFLGYNWRETSNKVFGRCYRNLAGKRISRFFAKNRPA